MMIDDENENPFISVLPNDARYVKQSYASDKPVIGSDGNPIGSGHREFANYANSQIGATSIANFIGTFMQIRIGINIEK